MAYLLINFYNYTGGPVVDRAWAVRDAVFGDSDSGNESTRIAGIQVEKNILLQPLQKLLKRARCVRKQAAQQAFLQAEELNDARTHDSGYKTNSAPTKEPLQTSPHEKTLLGDPFLGSVGDFGEKMDRENWDSLVQSFQTDLLQQQESMDCQGNNPAISSNWW
jgi:hypothetical protein